MQSVGLEVGTVAIVSRNDFDCLPEVALKSLAIDSKKNDS